MAGVLCNSTGPEIALLTACPLLAFAPLTNAAPPSLTVPPINLSRRLERRGSAPVDGSLACCTPHTVAPVFDTRAIRLLIPLGYIPLTRGADCSGQVISTFDVQELTSDDIQSARCSLVGAHDSAMGDCSGGAAMQFAWRMLLFTLYFVL